MELTIILNQVIIAEKMGLGNIIMKMVNYKANLSLKMVLKN